MEKITGRYGGTLCLDKYKGLVELCIEDDRSSKKFIYIYPVKLKKAVDSLATDIKLENKEKR